MRKLLSSLAVAAAMAVPSALHATPITGQFSVTGSNVTDNGTSLSFDPSTVSVGSQSTLTGSFSSLLTAGESGRITTPIDYAAYVPNTAQIIFGNAGSQVTFTLASITEVSNGAFGLFTGTGTISTDISGYDANPNSTLLFSTQGNGVTTFSATASSLAPVPEPSTLALLGTGILGAAGAIKRRLA